MTNIDLHLDVAEPIERTDVEEVMQLLSIHHRKLFDFREAIYELAFGDGAVNKDYSDKEVIDKLSKDLQIKTERTIDKFSIVSTPITIEWNDGLKQVCEVLSGDVSMSFKCETAFNKWLSELEEERNIDPAGYTIDTSPGYTKEYDEDIE